jgi:hypothetical protein
MFTKKFEDRMREWKLFREGLELSETPIEDTIMFWNTAPLTSIAADPWDQQTWPDPWEMIEENIFCPFVKILAILYTLQLTDRFSQYSFEINIVQDNENCETKYLLFVDGLCIGYDYSKPISVSDLPKSMITEKSYAMPNLQ